MSPCRRKRLEYAAAALVFVVLAVTMTWPLGRCLRTGIPYTDRPQRGSEILSLVEGDHLQLYYHYWLFQDALYGETPWFADPYEFHGDPGFRRFTTQRVPDSAAAAILSLGDMPTGYNLWALLTTAAAGLVAYGLARLYGFHPLASTFAGVVYAFLPYRMGHLCGGHQTGFALWLYPASLLAFETALRSPRPWLGGALAGLTILSASLTDVQVAFYLILGFGSFASVRGLQTFLRTEGSSRGDVPPFLRFGIPAGSAAVVAVGIAQTLRRFDPPGSYVGCLWFVGWGIVAWVSWARTVARGVRWPPVLTAAILVAAAGYAMYRTWAVAAMVISLAPLVTVRWVSPQEAVPRLRRLAVLAVPFLVITGVAVAWALYDVAGAVTETAWRNLRAGEARLYSPWLSDAWALADDTERRVAPGLAAFAVGALGFLRGLARRRTPDLRADRSEASFPWILWTVYFLLAFGLAFGPRLRHLAPLYDWAGSLVPFYEKGRTTSRVFTLAALALSVIGAFGLDGVLRARFRGTGVRAAVRVLVAAAIVAALGEYRPPRGVGISLLPRSPSVYEGQTEGTTLALPIWPGDSSPSSVYLYYATESRARLLNGYSPIVSRSYVERVFHPLSGANYGEWTASMAALLRELDCRRVILHEERFPDRLSPFGPGLTVLRTFASPALRHETSDGPLHRFRVVDPSGGPFDRAPARSSLGLFLRATDHAGTGGRPAPAPDALGGAVVEPRPSRPDGFLIKTPPVGLPSGGYRCTFRLRLRRDDGSGRPLLLLRARDGDRILAERLVSAKELTTEGFTAADIVFHLDEAAGVAWTAWREPGGEVECEGILVTTEPALPRDRIEAELSRYRGWMLAAPWASAGRVVVGGGPGFPGGEIMATGPGRIFGPGRYRAEAVLGRDPSVDHGEPARVLVRAVDAVEGDLLGEREATVEGEGRGRAVGFDVELRRDTVVDVQVRYLGGGSCCMDFLRFASAGEEAGP